MKKCTYYIDLDIEKSISQDCISLRRGAAGHGRRRMEGGARGRGDGRAERA